MITIVMNPGKVEISGHAGYAPAGQDIICAAVSAIGYTLIASLQRTAPHGLSFTAKPGYMCITCPDSEESRQAFSFAADGFGPIAEQNSAYVKFYKNF